MTDQTIPADKAREIAAAMRAAMRRDDPYYSDGSFLEDMSHYIRDLEDLLPNPPLPTLSDMTEEERAACQGMQADVTSRSGHYVVATPHDDGDDAAVLIDPDGEVDWVALEYVTPRPDLPRLEWSDKRLDPAPTLPDGWRFADHQKHGRVIVITAPNSAGNVYFVFPDAGSITGCDWNFCTPEELTYLDTEPDADAVPPNTLAEGSVWGDADALARACEESGRDQIVVLDRDGGAYVWDEMAEWWEGSAPPRFAPYTILHEGKKADQ